jgi:hypothetical protein
MAIPTASASMDSLKYSIFCMGNALLDIQVTNGKELLEKYGLKENNAILANEKHYGMCACTLQQQDLA